MRKVLVTRNVSQATRCSPLGAWKAEHETILLYGHVPAPCGMRSGQVRLGIAMECMEMRATVKSRGIYLKKSTTVGTGNLSSGKSALHHQNRDNMTRQVQCTCIILCSAQSRNLCNLEIALRILRIPKLCANLEIAQSILRLHSQS